MTKQSDQQEETPTPTEPDVMTDVWKVSKMYVHEDDKDSEGIYRPVREYTYDESGREKGCRYYSVPGSGEAFFDFSYQNVKRRDRPFYVEYVSLCGEDAQLTDYLAVRMSEPQGVYTFTEKFDDRGNLIEVSKMYSETEYVDEKWEYEFDDQNRAVKMKDYEYANGGLELFRYFLYEYDSFDRVKSVEEYWSEDNGRLESKVEYDYVNNRMVRTSFDNSIYGLEDRITDVVVFSGKQRVSLKRYRGNTITNNLEYLVLKGNFPHDEDFLDEVFPFGKRYRGVSMEKLDQDGYYQKESYWKLDEKGRPVSLSDDARSDDEVCLTYDDQDYVIRAEVTENGRQNIYEYAYDENGNMTEVRITNEDGQTHSYLYEWVLLPNR